MYTAVACAGLVASMKMNPSLEQAHSQNAIQIHAESHIDDEEEKTDAEKEPTGFFGRVKRDYKIIKEVMKIKVVWRFYLYWIVKGFWPSFSGPGYTLVRDVYKISDIQYGMLTTVLTISIMAGIWMFYWLFSMKEIRTL
jgi:hypothetical protein